VGKSTEELQGNDVSALPWIHDPSEESREPYPWELCINEGHIATDKMVRIESAAAGQRVFKINAAPIHGEEGAARGVLASLTDVTSLEVRNVQLADALSKLKTSRDQVREQNERLRQLATRDPLTGCLNRRAFFEVTDQHVEKAEHQGQPLSYIIVDVDHFKSINDNHGHAVGDKVLKMLATLLHSSVEGRGFVCRYGGEEFSVLLPQTDIEQATQLAEAMRARIERTSIAHLRVTACFGLAEFDRTSPNPRDTVNQADQALYAAKRSGRNRVVRWDQMPRDLPADEADARSYGVADNEGGAHIPFTTVSALSSALHHRDPVTAEHSRRVAELCVATAHGLMSEGQRYVLEVAALLHDIGKLGVPDAILMKAGPLTQDEVRMMRRFETVGVRIMENSFDSSELVEVVRTYRARFDGTNPDPSLPAGEAIPLGARILMICDAYEAMTTDRVYRKGMPKEEALAELRRHAGTQFDPRLVERFIETIASIDARRQPKVADVSRQAMLQIGTQLERVACALDAKNTDVLKTMANRLQAAASTNGIDEIAACAGHLASVLEDDAEWLDVINLTSELMELCRQAQYACTSDEDLLVAGDQPGNPG
jgi:diguanylate cyclase (GGDEF)-like protein